LGDGGHIDACDSILRQMQRAGLKPSMITYSILINRAGMWCATEKAEKYYEQMVLEGIIPDTGVYNAMINAYAKIGSTDRAIEVYRNMIECNITPTTITLNRYVVYNMGYNIM